MPKDLLILHTNDIHGRSEGLARVITRLDQIRAENSDRHVLYFDAGDVEDTSNRLSNLTKGRAMYELLALAKPNAMVAGNGSIARYGVEAITAQANVMLTSADCPYLLANVRLPDGNPIPATQSTHLLTLEDVKIGIIGVTAQSSGYARFFGLQLLDTTEVVRQEAASFWQSGVHAVIVLSHLGLADDRKLAEALNGEVTLIIGAHSHDLLPDGEWVNGIPIVQAGDHAKFLGQVKLGWRDNRLVVTQATVQPITEDIPPDPRVHEREMDIEAYLDEFLAETIGELAQPLDWSEEAECGVGNLMADALREYLKADIGLVVAGAAFKGGLPGGTLARRDLWVVCDTTANPGLVMMKGWQVQHMVETGLDPTITAERPHSLRGRARGLIHISGATVREGRVYVGEYPLDPEDDYRVAASDYELEPDFGYAQADWNLTPTYEVPTILREVVVKYLADTHPTVVTMERILGNKLLGEA